MRFQFNNVADNCIGFFKTPKGKKLKALAFIAVISAILFSQLLFNILNLFMFDDYSYSFSWENREKLESFNQLIPSVLSHNQTVNGRSVNHFIAHFFLLLNNLGFGIAFDIANTLIYLALIALIYYHSKGTFRNFRLWWFGAIHLCLWLFIPAYSQSFYWLIGSCNYSWSMVTALLYMVPFTYYSNRAQDAKANIPVQILLAALYIPCGMLAGNTNENTAVALVVMIILFCVKFIAEKRKLRIWMFSGLAGVIIGFCAMLLSPGQQLRAQSGGGLGGIGTWIKNAAFITFDVFDYLAVPLVLLFVALTLVFVTNPNLKLKDFSFFLVFLIGSGSAIYCMMVSPQFPERSWTPPVIFAIIAFGQLLSLIKSDNTIYRRVVCAVLAISTICFGASYIKAFLDIKQSVIACNEREAYISQQLKHQEDVLLLKPVKGWSKYNIFTSDGDLGASSQEWPNTAIAGYYGVKKVINAESEEGILYENSK